MTEERELLIAQQLEQAAAQVVANGWQLPQDGSWQWVQSSPYAKVACIRVEGEEYYFKAFLPRGRVERIKTLLRGSRAARCRRHTRALRAYGFSAPDVIAAQTGGRIPWVVMEGARGVAWADYLASFLTGPQSAERLRWKRDLICALGAEVGRLHKLGFAHGDLRPFNVLVDASAREPLFHFIDNERSRRPPFLHERERVRNLVQINMLQAPQIQRTDRLRFWRAYCETAGLPVAVERRLRVLIGKRLAVRLAARPAGKPIGNAGLSTELLEYLPG
jgi:tRNA A-37 threonylcarbamoyl transferase component Bud32